MVVDSFFFFQSGSVSVCEVTYSDKALGWEWGGGGVAANTP